MTFKPLLTATAMALVLAACSDTKDPQVSDTSETIASMADDYVSVVYDTDGQRDEDHLWLEEVEGDAALTTVKAWNKRSLDRLKADPRYDTLYNDALEILQSKDRIAYVSYRGGAAHNFWQDETNVRGVWRKTTMDSYLSDNTEWETVLDFDKLAEAEDKNWVYKGNNCLSPDFTMCMINLSDGGKDAVVRREFNTETGEFVKDGFVTPESKGTIDWVDADTMVVAVDFGEGTMTDSGYPSTARLWTRGQALEDSIEIGRGNKTDVGYWPGVMELSDGRREIMVSQSETFYDTNSFWFPRNADGSVGDAVKIPVPTKSNLGSEFKGQMLLSLNEDWRGYKSGDLVSFAWDDFAENGEIDTLHLVYSPDAKSSMGGYGVTKDKVLLATTTDVKGSVRAYDWDGKTWTSKPISLPANGAAGVGGTNSKESIAFLSAEDFLTPDTLYTIDTSQADLTPVAAKSLPDWFDASNMVSEQKFATSKDGTQVPYFVVRAKDTVMNGKNPTLLYGYGGFEISLNPSYSATRGKLWLENGGVYVLANIRGGGEYGPNWHQAGLKTERQRIYDDFIAVGEDLIETGLTSSDHLGIEGGSNGGLLTGVMTTQRPDLFGAAIIAVPLLDMQRFHTLLAGASWMGEFGNPEDPVEGKFLRRISPYHNIRPDVDYPEVFLITSTKDDRVHPGHARKFAKRMEDQGHDFLYYENIDGGHSAAANLKETANRLALQHVYLLQKLADDQ
ncbi:putative peptidase y4nA [Algimonas arctica]|uniref:Putative peptidase y4nA n=1 Tax=Algimonas arctica TaxID=1479486 RepID=A0A8J3G1K1_9PROT|nr:prolyl oligopeptidase family serine peptidase [Algimonas arctica]GHA86742.1 putative peptidase y4nA [Algimonas arctica]